MFPADTYPSNFNYSDKKFFYKREEVQCNQSKHYKRFSVMTTNNDVDQNKQTYWINNKKKGGNPYKRLGRSFMQKNSNNIRQNLSRSPIKNFYNSTVTAKQHEPPKMPKNYPIFQKSSLGPSKKSNEKNNLFIQNLHQKLKYFEDKYEETPLSPMHMTTDGTNLKHYGQFQHYEYSNHFARDRSNHSMIGCFSKKYNPKQVSQNKKNIEKSGFSKNQKYSNKENKAPFLEYQNRRRPVLEDFVIGDCKGQGRFGKVYLAIHKKTGFIFALKKIKKEAIKHMMDQFIRELKIQQFLSHPNLVKIYGYFADKEYFYMMIQYMEEGSVYSIMKKNSKLSEQETSRKMHQVCSGIKFMHQHDIVHRDLKPQNIVLTHDVCKICDFGWATVCVNRRSTYCGTLDYVCPEIADGKQYDSSVDIWCLGVMAYQMMCGKAPFYNISRQKTIQNIKQCQIADFPSHLSRSAVKFIRMILHKNPSERVDINQLLNSQFLRNSKQ